MGSAFRLRDWLVDPSLNLASRNGTSVRLEPKVMSVLICLAGRSGETITKQELLQTVWPDTFVTDDVLKHCVSELRRVFEDDARQPHTIETISKRGYRLIAPVEPVNGNDHLTGAAVPRSGATAATGSRRWRLRPAIVCSLVLAVALIVWAVIEGIRHQASIGSPAIRSLAVLPLKNLSADPRQEYLSEGFTDSLITELAQIKAIKVISRTSSMQYKDSQKSLGEIARELKVDGIVEGTIQRSGNHVRITAQLIYAPSDKHVWAASYDRDAGDGLSLEGDLTHEIANQVQARLSAQSDGRPRPVRRTNATALDAYLQGSYHLHRYGNGGGDEEKHTAAEYFQKAIDADPGFAAAYNGLARANFELFWPAMDSADIALTAAQRAVALDPDSSDAHATLGWISECDWNLRTAEQEFRRAVALNPNDAEAHSYLGVLLDNTGRFEEGWREHEAAQELDPNHDHLSDALMFRGKYGQAIATVQMFLNRYPDDGYLHWTLFKDYVQTGHTNVSVTELERAWAFYGHPQIASQVHHAYEVGGYRAAIRVLAEALRHLLTAKQVFMPGNIGEFYASIGEKDRAMYWLEQAYAQHRVQRAATDLQLQFLNVDFRVDSLRSDSRFQDLVRRIGLPEVKSEESASDRRATVIAR